jgi:hypothetical protein
VIVSLEDRELNTLGFGIKLLLIGGLIFVTTLVIYMQPILGFDEQVLLSWVMMASFVVWLIGALYLGNAGDQWLSRGIRYQSR